MSEERTKGAARDEGAPSHRADLMRPGPDAPAEPYCAIMSEGQGGRTEGNIWSFGARLMLFFDRAIGERVMTSVSTDGAPYVIRGVTEAHLAKLQHIVEDSQLELFVALRIRDGSIEAIPVHEHLAEAPPTLPPPWS